MRNKWFFSVCIIALTILGIGLEQSTTPNQQLVLRVTNSQNSASPSQNTIALLKSQLENSNASNIKIEQFRDGSLILSYYSDLEIKEVKQLLENLLSSQNEDNSSNQYPNTYVLDVYNIQQSSDFDGIVGTLIESKYETTRATSLTGYAVLNKQFLERTYELNIPNSKCNSYKTVAWRNIRYSVPQVRAGPNV